MQEYIDQCLADLGRVHQRIDEVCALPHIANNHMRINGLYAARDTLAYAICEMQNRSSIDGRRGTG